MSKNKTLNSLSGLGGLVYSTDPDVRIGAEESPVEESPATKQVLRIWLERVKGGKEATVGNCLFLLTPFAARLKLTALPTASSPPQSPSSPFPSSPSAVSFLTVRCPAA